MSDIRVHNATMPYNLDVALIRTFVAVAEYASMTAAGNALNLTQSAVSQQVARLESAFGCPLFVRERRRGLRLTAAGERLLGKARFLLATNDEIWTDLTASRVEGAVRLGFPYDLAATVIAPVLKVYSEAFPHVEISLVCSSSPNLLDAAKNSEIDIAVIEEPGTASRGECLAVERLVWVGAVGGSAHLKTPLPVSLVAETCAFRPVVLTALRKSRREWRTVFENGSIDATTATVRTDMAVTTLLQSTVPPDLDILTTESGLPTLPMFAIGLCIPHGRQRPAVKELARYIRQSFARHRQAA